MQSIKCILVMAATVFVGMLAITVLFTKAVINEKLLTSLALASLGTALIFLGPAFLSWWAHDVKQEHERKVNDGSFGYRLSQIRYVISLLILAAVAIVIFLAIANHRGRGGG